MSKGCMTCQDRIRNPAGNWRSSRRSPCRNNCMRHRNLGGCRQESVEWEMRLRTSPLKHRTRSRNWCTRTCIRHSCWHRNGHWSASGNRNRCPCMFWPRIASQNSQSPMSRDNSRRIRRFRPSTSGGRMDRHWFRRRSMRSIGSCRPSRRT
jgi:hypothetical protein